ncbi:hypothetical protein PIB30_027721 [Stylosanthes scabra]|uniref:Uncharacterized protein n=1 Tax=Stylosanthes scabra TaxID=79078 RepID=A0ABU6WBX2_9FABA|nr:hypothetical protein [Stylosanthes scabra]
MDALKCEKVEDVISWQVNSCIIEMHSFYSPNVRDYRSRKQLNLMVECEDRRGYSYGLIRMEAWRNLTEEGLGRAPPRVCVWSSRQKPLCLLCSSLCQPPPEYQKQSRHSPSRGQVHRFLVCVPSGPRFKAAIAAAGRYSTDEHLARDDAASELIKKILDITGAVIDDFNHDMLEESQAETYAVNNTRECLQARYEDLKSTF